MTLIYPSSHMETCFYSCQRKYSKDLSVVCSSQYKNMTYNSVCSHRINKLLAQEEQKCYHHASVANSHP